jgi:hypothetical protein
LVGEQSGLLARRAAGSRRCDNLQRHGAQQLWQGVPRLVLDAQPGILYAAGQGVGETNLISSDDGASWQPLPLPAIAGSNFLDLAAARTPSGPPPKAPESSPSPGDRLRRAREIPRHPRRVGDLPMTRLWGALQ